LPFPIPPDAGYTLSMLITALALAMLFAPTSAAASPLEELKALAPAADISAPPQATPAPAKSYEDAPFAYDQVPAEVTYLDDETAVIANFRTGPLPQDRKSYTWQTLTVRLSGVARAIYSYTDSRFGGVGHTYTTYIFDAGAAHDGAGREVRALALGAEGRSRAPGGFSFVDALAGRYPLMWLAADFDSYADTSLNLYGTSLHFKRTALLRPQARALFLAALKRVQETNRDAEPYRLLKNSCAYNQALIYNSVLPAEQRIKLNPDGPPSLGAALPHLVLKRFQKNEVVLPHGAVLDAGNRHSFNILDF
jgi:hypothetical protein